MSKLELIWRFMVTSVAVWRLSQALFGNLNGFETVVTAQEESGSGRFWARRAADFVCWISVWLSSQTAIWIACGFAGVLLSRLSMAGVSRLFIPAAERDRPRLGCVDGIQARHG